MMKSMPVPQPLATTACVSLFSLSDVLELRERVNRSLTNVALRDLRCPLLLLCLLEPE